MRGRLVLADPARQAGKGIAAILRENADAHRVRERYIRFVEGSSAPFFRLVRSYYEHSFRELFLEAQGPLSMHRAVLSVLAGNVFPRPPFALRWRLALFNLFVRLNKSFPLVPRRERFSLLNATPAATGLEADAEPLATSS